MGTWRTSYGALGSTIGGVVVALALGGAEMPVAAEADHMIQLTQTGCQFLEPENGVDRGFEPRSAEDCNRINAETVISGWPMPRSSSSRQAPTTSA